MPDRCNGHAQGEKKGERAGRRRGGEVCEERKWLWCVMLSKENVHPASRVWLSEYEIPFVLPLVHWMRGSFCNEYNQCKMLLLFFSALMTVCFVVKKENNLLCLLKRTRERLSCEQWNWVHESGHKWIEDRKEREKEREGEKRVKVRKNYNLERHRLDWVQAVFSSYTG